MKVLQFGAGNIGRGFLGELFHNAGYEIVFVEKDKNLVDEINRKGKYTLEIVGPRKFERYEINGVTAIDAEDGVKIREHISQADLIAVSVGIGALPSVSVALASGLELRNKRGGVPINIIIAENILNAKEFLYGLLSKHMDEGAKKYLDENVGLVQAVISRMVPVLAAEVKSKDPLYIKAEEYRELPVDKGAFRGKIPEIDGMEPYEHFEAYEERKLFIHNTGHAVAAYLGFLKGYTYIYEAMGDRYVREKMIDALEEAGRALTAKHPFLGKDLRAYIEDLCMRFSNKALGDTVVRVGRDPIRKLGLNDRLVGACRLVERYGRVPENLSLGISACLLYSAGDDPSSVALQDKISKKGIDHVLSEICGIKKGETLYELVKKGYSELKKGVRYEVFSGHG